MRVDQLLDNNLQRVQEHNVVVGELPPKYPRYHGTGIVRLPTGQEIIEEFVLDGAENILEAYKLFPAVHSEVTRRTGEQFRQYMERMEREANRAALAKHRDAESKKIIVPGEKEDKRGGRKLIIGGK